MDQTWQGTKVAPRIPTKKRMINRPLASVTVPASAVGMDPARRTPGGVVNIGSLRNKRLYIPAKTYRGPYLSQSGPTINLMMRLNRAVRAITLQRLLDLDLRCNQGHDVGVSNLGLGKMKIFLDGFGELIYVSTAYQKESRCLRLTNGGKAYHERNAIINPKVEKKNVLPYLSKGLKIGTESAFLFTGLTLGAFQRILTPIVVMLMLRILDKNIE